MQTTDATTTTPRIRSSVPVDALIVDAYTVPTDAPESDGTLRWDATTIVTVRARAGGLEGLGYTYADASAADVASRVLGPRVVGEPCFDVAGAWAEMVRAVRNIGRRGIAAAAISAVDTALWDLKARLLGLPLVSLLGRARRTVPTYASGGFTSCDDAGLHDELAGYVADGFRAVKMKIGRDRAADAWRVRTARAAIGSADLMVDANGAYTPRTAIGVAQDLADVGVVWFEEPVSSDDLTGLHRVRSRAPGSIEVAAGEYGSDPWELRWMLDAGAVDVLQVDATRCCGVTGFMRTAASAASSHVPVSAHTAPQLHAHVCCAVEDVRHVEWFADHVRIEAMLFDGALEPVDGRLRPDVDRPGMGLAFREADAERYRVRSTERVAA